MLLRPSFARLDAPIVLAHGLAGFSRIGMGRLTLTTYFRGVPEALLAAGNRVLVTRVAPIAGAAGAALGRSVPPGVGRRAGPPGRPQHGRARRASPPGRRRMAATRLESHDDRVAPPR